MSQFPGLVVLEGCYCEPILFLYDILDVGLQHCWFHSEKVSSVTSKSHFLLCVSYRRPLVCIMEHALCVATQLLKLIHMFELLERFLPFALSKSFIVIDMQPYLATQ